MLLSERLFCGLFLHGAKSHVFDLKCTAVLTFQFIIAQSGGEVGTTAKGFARVKQETHDARALQSELVSLKRTLDLPPPPKKAAAPTATTAVSAAKAPVAYTIIAELRF